MNGAHAQEQIDELKQVVETLRLRVARLEAEIFAVGYKIEEGPV